MGLLKHLITGKRLIIQIVVVVLVVVVVEAVVVVVVVVVVLALTNDTVSNDIALERTGRMQTY